MEFCSFEIDVILLQTPTCPLHTHTDFLKHLTMRRPSTGHRGPASATSPLESQQEQRQFLGYAYLFIGQVFLKNLTEEHGSCYKMPKSPIELINYLLAFL